MEQRAERPPFWRNLHARGNALAIIDAQSDTHWTYSMLATAVDDAAECFSAPARALLMLFASKDVGGIVCYLGALNSGNAVFLSPVGIDHPGAADLVDRYRPEILLFRGDVSRCGFADEFERRDCVHGYELFVRIARVDPPPHENLGLILSTSASSGSPKAVRLPTHAIQCNARDVSDALAIDENERALLSLPFSYVYGLSVLNSCLYSGAAVVLVQGVAVDRRYWSQVSKLPVTSLAAVSQTFQSMRALDIDWDALSALRKVTHSGDCLNPELFDWVFEKSNPRGVAIYLMYGQTEAGGRMTVLPPALLPQAHRSVGKPIGSSRVRVDPNGEILFSGPGVMLGYANGREDLSLGDTQAGEVRTGDIGHVDAAGLLYITGRLSRYCKIEGQRISLDEVERVLGPARVAAIEKDAIIWIFYEGPAANAAVTPMVLAHRFHIPPGAFRICSVRELPHGERGKVAYAALFAMSGREATVGRPDQVAP